MAEQDYFRPSRKDREDLETISAAVGIRHGVQCKNYAHDQGIIQSLLNKIPTANGGTLYPTGPVVLKAARDGYCDPTFGSQILRFQQHNGLGADGAIDPGGPTLRALKTLAAGGRLAQPKAGPSAQAQNYINHLYDLVDVGKAALKEPGLPPSFSGSLSAQIASLEKNLKASGLKRAGPSQARNYAGVVGIGALIILAFAAMTVTLMDKKALVAYVKGLGQAAVSFTTFCLENQAAIIRLTTDFWLWRMQQAAKVVIAIEAEVEKVANKTRCKDKYSQYKLKSRSALEKIGRYATLPGMRFARTDFDIISTALSELMFSLYELLICSGGGSPDLLLRVLSTVSGGAGVIRFIIEQLGGRKWVFPFPVPGL